MIRTHSCYSAICDVCKEPVRDPDSEATVHFDTEADARTAARAQGWLVTPTIVICPWRDQDHQDAIDALMPAEPMPSNQPELPAEESRP